MNVTLPLFSFHCRFFLKKSKINSAGERRREGWREAGMETYGLRIYVHASVKKENLKLNKQKLMRSELFFLSSFLT